MPWWFGTTRIVAQSAHLGQATRCATGTTLRLLIWWIFRQDAHLPRLRDGSPGPQPSSSVAVALREHTVDATPKAQRSQLGPGGLPDTTCLVLGRPGRRPAARARAGAGAIGHPLDEDRAKSNAGQTDC